MSIAAGPPFSLMVLLPLPVGAMTERGVPMPEQWFSVGETAKHFGVSSRTVRRLIDAGELRAIRVGVQVRISAAEMARFAKVAAH